MSTSRATEPGDVFPHECLAKSLGDLNLNEEERSSIDETKTAITVSEVAEPKSMVCRYADCKGYRFLECEMLRKDIEGVVGHGPYNKLVIKRTGQPLYPINGVL